MRSVTLSLNLLFIGLVMSYAFVARAVEIITVCPVLTSGDVCIFDAEATADGLLQVDTQASLEGDLWRLTVVEVNQPLAVSNIGTGSTMDFTGIIQQPAVSERQYQVFVTYEGPIPGEFPTSVTVRFDGPVTVSGPRPQGQPALSGIYAGRHSNGGNSVSIETSADGSHVVRIVTESVACGFGPAAFNLELDPGIPIIGQRFVAEAVPFIDIGIFERDGTLDIDGVVFDADGFGGTPEQGLGGFSILRSGERCNFEWEATAVATDSDRDGWSNTAEIRLGADPDDARSTPEHREVPTTAFRGPDTCHDFVDNDADELTDADDPDCRREP